MFSDALRVETARLKWFGSIDILYYVTLSPWATRLFFFGT
jgi:hypothetical protein